MAVRVEGLPCPCPGTPHESDWVELFARPTIAIGAAVHMAVALYGNEPLRMQAGLFEAEVVNGIVAWSFTRLDEKGKEVPIPVERDLPNWPDVVNEYLPFDGAGRMVADKADELYSKEVLRPLVEAISKPSANGRSGRSTSRNRRSGGKRPKPPKQSSLIALDGKRSEARAS